jgi:hypothetical protein
MQPIRRPMTQERKRRQGKQVFGVVDRNEKDIEKKRRAKTMQIGVNNLRKGESILRAIVCANLCMKPCRLETKCHALSGSPYRIVSLLPNESGTNETNLSLASPPLLRSRH